MVDKRSNGEVVSRVGVIHPPPLWKHCTASLFCILLLVGALQWEQKNNSAKATSSMEFMSCSSTQGHCGTQTLQGFSPDFSFGAAHTMYFADRQLIYYTWQKCQAVLAARRITPEQSQRDWRVMSNRTRPADPSCNMDSHLAGQASRINNEPKMTYQRRQRKAWAHRQ